MGYHLNNKNGSSFGLIAVYVPLRIFYLETCKDLDYFGKIISPIRHHLLSKDEIAVRWIEVLFDLRKAFGAAFWRGVHIVLKRLSQISPARMTSASGALHSLFLGDLLISPS